MATITTNIAIPGLKIIKTIISVWNSGNNVNLEHVFLTFDNNQKIAYDTELWIDLSDGEYEWDIINSNWKLI